MIRDYRLALRAKGIRPLPAYHKLRTEKRPEDRELCSGGVLYIHGEKKPKNRP